MMRLMEIVEFVKAALECSVYVAPREPGLSRAELLEAGRRAGYGDGELGGAFSAAGAQSYFGSSLMLPSPSTMSGDFHIPEDPDYRSVDAFDFVCREFRDVARKLGPQGARIDRSVLVQRAAAKGLREHDVEVALTILVMIEHLSEEEDEKVLKLSPRREHYPLPSEQVGQGAGAPSLAGRTFPRAARGRAHPIVSDVIARRSDSRPLAAEPLEAFGEKLGALSYQPFRMWWTQMVGELRRLDPALSPVAVAVIAAALVEGVLTFVVRHARDQELGVFGSTNFDRDPRTWKVEDLVSSACAGRDAAILDGPARARADELIKTRQRIHAGGMLSEYPGGVPDLRPEEARDAKATADLVVRRVVDWLGRYPPK